MNEPLSKKHGYILRLAEDLDAENYFSGNFAPMDPETKRLTGTEKEFTRDEVLSFFYKCRKDSSRDDFVIVDPSGKIIGEAVLNEPNADDNSINFRIALFHSADFGKGLGTWATEHILRYAFEIRKYDKVTLSVYSHNPRAIKLYESFGFETEAMIPCEYFCNGEYADELLMNLTRESYYLRANSLPLSK